MIQEKNTACLLTMEGSSSKLEKQLQQKERSLQKLPKILSCLLTPESSTLRKIPSDDQVSHIEHFETVRQRKDGRRIEVSLSISPVKDRAGRIIGAAKIARDLSDRRQTERARLHLAALVESADTPIIGKTSEGIITSWNLAAQHLYGYSAQEAVDQPITLIFPADRQQESVTIMQHIRQGERVELYETIRQRKDSSLILVSVVVSPIYDQAGQLIGASDMARGITERKRAENEQHLLEHLSHILASTLDAQVMLTKVGNLLVAQWTDWWSLDLVDATGQITLEHC